MWPLIRTAGRCLAIKAMEVLTQAAMWVTLENMMGNESSWTQKTTYCMMPCIGSVQTNPQGQKADEWLLGEGGHERLLTLNGVSLRKHEDVLELDRRGGCPTL